MNPTLRNETRRDAIYHAAVREHQADPCEWCGATENNTGRGWRRTGGG